MPTRIKIENKTIFLHVRKFCLECSPFGKHNTRDLRIKLDKSMDDPDSTYKKSRYPQIKKSRHNKKQKLVELSGGKCSICGYDKCMRNLHFHHVNPEDKSFGISKGGLGHGFHKTIKEIKKCILVCSNCHGEIHDGQIDANMYYNQI